MSSIRDIFPGFICAEVTQDSAPVVFSGAFVLVNPAHIKSAKKDLSLGADDGLVARFKLKGDRHHIYRSEKNYGEVVCKMNAPAPHGTAMIGDEPVQLSLINTVGFTNDGIEITYEDGMVELFATRPEPVVTLTTHDKLVALAVG